MRKTVTEHRVKDSKIRAHVSGPRSLTLQFHLHLSKGSVTFSNQTILMKLDALFFFFLTEYCIALNSLQ